MSAPKLHSVSVGPLPSWLDHGRFVGYHALEPHETERGVLQMEGRLPAADAADLAARLRGLGVGGLRPEVRVEPPLPRTLVRAARLDDARRRRDTTPGFNRPGARLDDEGRMSLTPEALALELGQRVRGCSVVDATAGAGGNSIGFARSGCQVTAIEPDAQRFSCLQHNARLYGVAERMTLERADARARLPALAADLLFIDPPWGKDHDRLRSIAADMPLLLELLPLCARYPRTWLKLPASFDPSSLPTGVRSVEAMFGVAPGDHQRIKFLLIEL